MESILVMHADFRPFERAAVEKVFLSDNRFQDIRQNMSVGTLIEAEFVEPADWTIVRLMENASTISFSGTSQISLRAALLFQQRIPGPLRIVDTAYSFDLPLSEFTTLEELSAAIDAARSRTD